MKRIVTGMLVLLLLLGTFGVTAFAEASQEVYVTIADDKGNLVLAMEPITAADTDDDGIITVDEVLYAAHEATYEGGAAAGYASADSEYGKSLVKLWGVANGGSYGYCVNHASAMSLADPVQAGDVVSAYAYTDLTAWSDTYCYFDQNTVVVKEGETVTLTLSAAGYDENWAPITLPVEGATITVDGQATQYKTDAQGKVTLAIDAGSHVISAVSDTATLVPPVCLADVEAAVETKTDVDDGDNTIPETGDSSVVALATVLGIAALSLVYSAAKKSYEN